MLDVSEIDNINNTINLLVTEGNGLISEGE